MPPPPPRGISSSTSCRLLLVRIRDPELGSETRPRGTSCGERLRLHVRYGRGGRITPPLRAEEREPRGEIHVPPRLGRGAHAPRGGQPMEVLPAHPTPLN